MSPASLRGDLRQLAIRALLRLYPAAWRRRYGAEFAALLAQRSLSPLEVVDLVRGAIDARWQASRGVRVATSSATQASCVAPQCCQKGREHDMARRDNRFRCSFCGKSRDQVRRLIAGPNGVYICDECVALCNQIIADEETPLSCQRPEEARSAVRRRAAPRWQRLMRRWLEIGRGERLRMTAPQPIVGTASSSA